MRTHTFTTTYVTCRDCGHKLELAQDDEDATMYYTCEDCGIEWTLEGKRRET